MTIAALIARNQTKEMPHYINLALYNGVKPREGCEIITHLAFYSGWANAMSSPRMSLRSIRLEPISFLLLRLRSFPSTRTPRRSAQVALNSSSVKSLPESFSTPLMFCSVIFGSALTLLPEIEV